MLKSSNILYFSSEKLNFARKESFYKLAGYNKKDGYRIPPFYNLYPYTLYTFTYDIFASISQNLQLLTITVIILLRNPLCQTFFCSHRIMGSIYMKPASISPRLWGFAAKRKFHI